MQTIMHHHQNTIMTKLFFSTLACLFLFLPASFSQNTEAKAVKQAFEKYKTSILNDQGEAALEVVDSRTKKYYTQILDVIKNADSMQVTGLSLIDKMTVFSIRHRVAKEEILKMDGKGLFIYAIKSGMVGKNGVANNTIGEIIVNEHIAKGQLVANGKKSPFYFHFYKEEGGWKLDLTSIFPISNMALKQVAKQSGENENEFFFNLLERLTGRRPGSEIWQKIN
jgi:hypothetical protein